jgi:hypothetical protein
MTRTKQETAATIARTIRAIRAHAIINNQVIKKECAKNNISEAVIRRIGIGNGTKITSLHTQTDDE